MKELNLVQIKQISGGVSGLVVLPIAATVAGAFEGAIQSESLCLQPNIFSQLSCVAGQILQGAGYGLKLGISAAWVNELYNRSAQSAIGAI